MSDFDTTYYPPRPPKFCGDKEVQAIGIIPLPPTFPPTDSPNYIDVICGTFTKQTVNYSVGLQMDIYKETCNVNTNRPVMICLHGGGGTKDNPSIIEYAQDFASRGYLGISAEYGATNPFSGSRQIKAIANVCAIIRYMRANAVLYGINPNNIFVMGVSAGGITAWQVNIGANDVDGGTPFFDEPINAENSGQSSMPSGTASQSGAATTGVLAYLTNASNPHFDYHGTIDCTVSYSVAQCGGSSGAVESYNAMIGVGVSAALIPFVGSAHILQPYHSIIILGGQPDILGNTDIGMVKHFAGLIVP